MQCHTNESLWGNPHASVLMTDGSWLSKSKVEVSPEMRVNPVDTYSSWESHFDLYKKLKSIQSRQSGLSCEFTLQIIKGDIILSQTVAELIRYILFILAFHSKGNFYI